MWAGKIHHRIPKKFGSSRSLSLKKHVPPPITKYGPGGRHSNSGIRATVFGAYGFVGRYIMNELGSCGSLCYAPYRGCEMEVRHLKPAFDLGQLGLMPFSPRDHASIVESLKNSDVVINLIGKHYETKHIVPTRRADGSLSRVNYDFDEVNVTIPRTIARLAKEAGVKSFIHMSALSASEKSDSKWSRTKALGEIAVREEFPESIIVRSATVFGPEDRFLNWIGETMSRIPVFPLINDGSALVQPVYAADVGKALFTIVENNETCEGMTFELAGPAQYSYKEVTEFVCDITTVKPPLVDIPAPIANFVAKFTEQGVKTFLTPDMVARVQEDNVLIPRDEAAEPMFKTFKHLGIEPQSMDKIAFDYLHRFRPGGHFTIVSGYH